MEQWIFLATLCLRLFLFNGSVKANGVILDDIVRQLQTSNYLVGWAFALQNGLAYLMSPLTFLLTDYFSYWQLCLFGGALTGVGYIFFGIFMNSVLELFISFVTSGIGFGFAILPSFLVLQEHFTPEDFPKIISTALMFDFVGVAILPPVLQFFRNQYGLGNSLVLLGALVWNNMACGIASRKPGRYKNKLKKSESGASVSEASPKQERVGEPRFCHLFRHKNLAILLILEAVCQYVFVSWALFLVSLGKTLGLSDGQAVTLSSAGGLGGLLGRLLAIFLFHTKTMTAFTSSFVPLLVTGSIFICVMFIKNFYALVILIFISGISQGLHSSAATSLVAKFVCSHHYKHALNLEYITAGFTMQSAGFVSGVIRDWSGSTIYVFVFNAFVCLMMIPLVIWWSCDEEPDLDCTSPRTKNNNNGMKYIAPKGLEP